MGARSRFTRSLRDPGESSRGPSALTRQDQRSPPTEEPPTQQDENDHGIGIRGWLTAIVGPLAVSGVLVAFRGTVFSTNAALVLVLPVLAAAIAGGRVGGAIAAVVSALCFDFFFTRPYYSFTINRSADVETMIVLLVVGLVVGELVVRVRRSERAAIASRRQVDQIRRVAELAAGNGSAGRLIDVVERELVELLGARGARFERPPFRTVLPQLGHGVVTIPATEPDGVPLGPANEVELPVWGAGKQMGRLVLVMPSNSVGVSIHADDRAIAVALVDQLGAVLSAANG